MESKDSLQRYNPDDLSTAQNKLIRFFINVCYGREILLWYFIWPLGQQSPLLALAS